MPKITLDISEELSDQLALIGDRLPELLAQCLQMPALSAHIYQYIVHFLATNPTPSQLVAFSPTPEMQERLKTLLIRSSEDKLTSLERKELDEYEKIEHLVIMLKAGSLSYLTNN